MQPAENRADHEAQAQPRPPNLQTPQMLAHIYDLEHRQLKEAIWSNASQFMAVYHRLDNFQHSFNRLQESAGALIRKSKDRGLQSLQKEVHLDVKALEDHCQGLQTLVESLRSHQATMELSERHFDKASRAIFEAFSQSNSGLREVAATGLWHQSASLAPSSHPETSPMPIQLEDFCREIGRSRNMRERLWELEEERQEQLERRCLLEDQEQVLEQTDEAFALEWDQILQKSKRDLQDAYEQAQNARRACTEAGVEIPFWAEVDRVGTQGDLQEEDSSVYYPAESGQETSTQEYYDATQGQPCTMNGLTKEQILRWREAIVQDSDR